MNLCVFCGSRGGRAEHHFVPNLHDMVSRLGQWMANQGITLVYGGGRVGLMGLLADAVLGAKGSVIGIIPDFLMSAEVAHPGCSDLIVVSSMQERKIAMLEQADASLTLPGGFGTLDELFEVLTMTQLKRFEQPILLFNERSFFQPLLEQLAVMEQWGFLNPKHRDLLEIFNSEAALYEKLRELMNRVPPSKSKRTLADPFVTRPE